MTLGATLLMTLHLAAAIPQQPLSEDWISRHRQCVKFYGGNWHCRNRDRTPTWGPKR